MRLASGGRSGTVMSIENDRNSLNQAKRSSRTRAMFNHKTTKMREIEQIYNNLDDVSQPESYHNSALNQASQVSISKPPLIGIGKHSQYSKRNLVNQDIIS